MTRHLVGTQGWYERQAISPSGTRWCSACFCWHDPGKLADEDCSDYWDAVAAFKAGGVLLSRWLPGWDAVDLVMREYGASWCRDCRSWHRTGAGACVYHQGMLVGAENGLLPADSAEVVAMQEWTKELLRAEIATCVSDFDLDAPGGSRFPIDDPQTAAVMVRDGWDAECVRCGLKGRIADLGWREGKAYCPGCGSDSRSLAPSRSDP